jgi:hypothetical protein
MAKVHINSGACGFNTTVETKMDGNKCTIAIDTDCEAIRALAGELTEVEPLQEISFRGNGPKTLELGAAHCYHTACPVPVGIIKAIEVAAGLNLPVDTSIKFIDE